MVYQVGMVLVLQMVLQERLVPIQVELLTVQQPVLSQVLLRSSVHCAKNGSRIHTSSSVPPSLITNSASPALGTASRDRGLDQRFTVQVERSAHWQTQMYPGRSCRVK
ncbi:hypothetical protein C0J52_07341 [Blattella germanica]|nr:hypothetical protein C0J52_07341 [Blattella germanica]